MKLTKVHLLGGAGVVVAAGIGLLLATRGEDGEKQKAAEEATTPHSARARRALERLKNAPMQAPVEAPKEVSAPLRSFDKEIVEYALGPAPAAEGKDVLPRLLPQVDVSLSRGEGTRRIHRLDIDLDRDGIHDERWTIGEDNSILRRAVARDSEARHHRDMYTFQGDHWMLRGGKGATLKVAEPTAEEVAANVAALALRPIDKRALELARSRKLGTHEFALEAGGVAKIVVMEREGARGGQMVLLDLDGDGDHDERWMVTPVGVRRSVPLAGEREEERFALGDGRWNRQH
jgi:hypothetical protein